MKGNNFVSVQTSWSVVMLLFCALLTPQSSFAQKQTKTISKSDETLNINTDLITFNVSVSDNYGRAVAGLKKKDFNIFDNGNGQEIHFFGDEDTPASIGIIFDTSGSMSENKINQAKEALANFIQTSHPRDEFFLIDFNSRTEVLLDRTRDSDSILRKFTYVEPKGNTALFDAVYLGLEKVMNGSHPKKIILVISDGEDNNSRYTYKELRQRLIETDVTIYAIGVGGLLSSGKGRLSGRDTLSELSSTSGGKAFFPKGSVEMNEAFERMALEIRHLYSISYYPSSFIADGKWHRLRVKVNFPLGTPRLTVRNRAGYYAGTN